MPSRHKLRGILRIAKKNQWLPQELPEALVGLISLVEAETAVDVDTKRSRAVALMEEHADKEFNAHRISAGSSFEALEYMVELCGQVLANLIFRRWLLEHSPQLGADLAAACERGLQKAKVVVQEEIEFHRTGDQKIDPSQVSCPPDLHDDEPESVGFPNLKSRPTQSRS